jgi:hypothetical protein
MPTSLFGVLTLPKRSNEFQKLVYLIQEQMKDRPDTVVTESKMLVDWVTGMEREVDIVVACKSNNVPFTLAFECRGRSDKAAIDWVEQMLKKHEHLSHKLVLVDMEGFSAAALRLAVMHGADTVVLNEATKTDWPARIDEYRELLFASFEGHVTSFSVEPQYPDGALKFNDAEMIDVTDVAGVCAPLSVLVDAMVQSQRQNMMDSWYRKPIDQRKSEHAGKYEYVPPSDQPMILSQGMLRYPMRKLTIDMKLSFGSALVKMVQKGYNDVRVAEGLTTMDGGGLAGHTVQVVMTEQQGQKPKAAMLLSDPRYADKPFVGELDDEVPSTLKAG